MRNNLRLERQEETTNKLKGILITDSSSEKNPIALIEYDRLIQFYNFNDGLSIDIVEAIAEIAKNFKTIFESLPVANSTVKKLVADVETGVDIMIEALENISEQAFDDDTPVKDVKGDFENMRTIAIETLRKVVGEKE